MSSEEKTCERDLYTETNDKEIRECNLETCLAFMRLEKALDDIGLNLTLLWRFLDWRVLTH